MPLGPVSSLASWPPIMIRLIRLPTPFAHARVLAWHARYGAGWPMSRPGWMREEPFLHLGSGRRALWSMMLPLSCCYCYCYSAPSGETEDIASLLFCSFRAHLAASHRRPPQCPFGSTPSSEQSYPSLQPRAAWQASRWRLGGQHLCLLIA